MNDRAALDLLLEHGPLSRPRVGELTGLSKPTASQLLARLEAAGLVHATGASEGRPGPNARLYAVRPAAGHAAGLDVAPHRVRAAVADITGRTVGAYELPTPGRGADGPERVVRQVTGALDGALEAAGLARADVRRLVVATPGAFDPTTGRLRYATHLPGWHSPTILEDLAAALPMPVEYENDVNLVALAEQRLGAARGRRDFVLLWNETGLGAALVLGGRLHRGWTGGAGEVGFLPVPGAALARGVASTGSGGFQELAGAQAVLELAHDLGIEHTEHTEHAAIAADTRHAANLERTPHAANPPHTGTSPSPSPAEAAAALLAHAASHATGPQRTLLTTYATRLATGLAALVSVLDPELVVLSGAVLTAGGEVLRAQVQAELAELAASRPHLVISEVREHPVLRGALESALTAARDEVFDTAR
ncbi:ROK family transcriptional regulator [Streptomyces sp. NPDC046985]|uniref:ROK family transcriptional regulator n=1 Tax=Streptomyces sp. NPDC046985 TaxID=3155377 RepID=UPI0033CE3A3E